VEWGKPLLRDNGSRAWRNDAAALGFLISGFKPRPEDQVSCLKFFMIFLSLSKQIERFPQIKSRLFPIHYIHLITLPTRLMKVTAADWTCVWVLFNFNLVTKTAYRVWVLPWCYSTPTYKFRDTSLLQIRPRSLSFAYFPICFISDSLIRKNIL
jgi:hypothetical protein